MIKTIGKILTCATCITTIAFSTSCSQPKTIAQQSSPATTEAAPQTLRHQLEPYFLVGTALSEGQVHDQPAGVLSLVKTQFNAVTAENVMKWEEIQATEGQFNWQDADTFIEYGKNNNLHLTGHVLLWHQQTPDWVFEDKNGQPASRDLILQRLKTHITQYVTRYKGKVDTWDVVNEALNDDGSLRQSKWLQLAGEDYIAKAFEYAHAADPNAELIYNDYNLFKPEKRDGAVRIVKQLQAKGIAIHGVGMQAHYSLGYPENLNQVEDSIVAFAKLGVNVHITELDLSVLPFPDKENQGADISLNIALQEKFNPYTQGLPNDIEQQFNQNYLNLFKIFIKHHDKIKRVTFWGVNDAQSWRNYWPMNGRTDYPLIIDRNNQLKPAANVIFEWLSNQ